MTPGPRPVITAGRRGRHAHQASYALTARRVALLAAGTAAGIVAAMVAAAVLAALCAVFLTGTGILLAAIRIPPRWALWAGVALSWPVADLWQGARLLPAGHMALAAAAAVMVAGCAAGLAVLRARRQRQWRQTGGRMTARETARETARREATRADLAQFYAELHYRVTLVEDRQREQERAWELWRQVTGRPASTPRPASARPLLRAVPDASDARGETASLCAVLRCGSGFLKVGLDQG